MPESDEDQAWKALWTESEERFYAHDVFSLDGLQWSEVPVLRILTPREATAPDEVIATADVRPGPPDGGLQRAAGEVRASEREIRIFDDTRTSAIDVRPGLGSRSRTVYRHETEPIGALERPRLAGRWRVVDAERALVIKLPGEGTITSADGRTVGSLTSGVFDLARDPDRLDNLAPAASAAELLPRGKTIMVGVLDLAGDPGRLVDRRLALAAYVSAVLERWYRN